MQDRERGVPTQDSDVVQGVQIICAAVITAVLVRLVAVVPISGVPIAVRARIVASAPRPR